MKRPESPIPNNQSLIRLGAIATFVLGCLLVWYFYDGILADLKNARFGGAGDAIKNYYTVDYHVRYDSTFSRFEGMNYPYGEQITFADAQPALVLILQGLVGVFPSMANHTIGIMNGLMLFSIAICALLLFFILMRLKLPVGYAVVAAIGIAFLSPQMTRLQGHYALAYMWAFPAVWLAALRFFESEGRRDALWLFAIVCLVSLLHLYYYALVAAFLLLMWAFYFLDRRSPKALPTYQACIYAFMHVLLPFILIKIWFLFTDGVGDRTNSPYGFLAYRGHWEGVFLPTRYPLGDWISTNIFPIRKVTGEALCYVGFPTAIASILMLGTFVFGNIRWGILRAIGKVAKPIGSPIQDKLFVHSFWAASIILVFSFGIPFIFGFEDLIPYLGPLKQFRSIGRFGWIFYYIINVIVFAKLYRYYRASRQASTSWRMLLMLTVIICAFAALYWEVHYAHTALAKNINKHVQRHELRPLFEDKKPQDYQALAQAFIPLPYFHIGSENMDIHNKGANIIRYTMEFSYMAGLPTIAVMMSRTSISQTWRNLSLLYENHTVPEIIKDFPNRKPFLLLIDKTKLSALSGQEKDMIQDARLIQETDKIRLMSLPFSYFETRVKRHRDWLESVVAARGDSTLPPYVYESFDDEPAPNTYRGIGARSGNLRAGVPIFKGTLPEQKAGRYRFACWAHLYPDRYPTAILTFKEYDEKGNQLASHQHLSRHIISVIDGEWALLAWTFTLHSPKNTIEFKLDRRDLDNSILLDDMLIHPVDKAVYWETEKGVYFNGRYWEQ